MRRPNFFIVGAPRSGTASMFSYLKQHPEIYCSIDKEPHFFGSDLSVMPGTIRDEAVYLQLFAGAGDRPRAGEASVWYLSSEKAPHEIHAFSPDAKIIVMLREPAQMAYSLYSLYSRTGNEDLPTFEESLAAEPERRQGRNLPAGVYFPEGLIYTDAAQNAAKVERYFEVFGRKNVFYVLFDDFVRDTAAVYRRALEFLGVDPKFEAELDPAKASQKVRLMAIRQLRDAPAEVKQRMQFKEMKQHDAPPRPPLSAETAGRLRELFAPDVERLGKAIGRDLSAWTRGEELAPPAPARSGARLREILDSVKVLKKIPADIRAKHERDETLARKFARWQKVRVPNLPLTQQPANPEWADWFARERAQILEALDRSTAVCEHFGSTSVPGLPSKNIVDIFVTLDAPPDASVEEALGKAGYQSWGNSPVDPETLWLWKVEDGRAFVIHLCEQTRPWLDEQRALREFLRSHPEERDRYAGLKKKLSEEIDQSFLQYTISKMSMSIEMIDRAKEWRAAGEAGENQGRPNRERSMTSL
jgi:GrpB-like predicted nucleotidyltransferase (UPF0157 family)